MVEKLSVGVIGIQGDVSEHIISMENAFRKKKIPGKTFIIRQKEDMKDVDALILPGGESTTISKILYKSGMHNAISNKIKENNLPIMGTCAGCTILASKLINNTNDVKLLNAMNIQVRRNAFGRQKESFEKNIDIKDFSKPYHAVFIRAPVIEKTWGKCKVVAKIDKKTVMARQDNMLALSFHPELTNDYRIHEYFIDMI
ncbi:MAG: pyridoxal 5'-phosphate synthase glutaminase subunit PdxT [Thermoplasmatales archaeon]|nr:MAG: pyridoxal 5'-phosphate synthase glutaminase subunit PdxT [Thermoplasmatales archaeon]